ncbi:periplasmic heavy metal sensor [Pseudoruegeria sp. SHC-113]|uniref:periplasmic heavy metal sensor n=1 Tax=Pseudoruegeria sp. SHC-113 TaxID=2855439 RepID=UPI0021BB2647|nr:periplasmic heavy metal sensor [Pseudoruegeria sp. SHC-113]MCT8159584.1 periplasmic heavy metal sensor [Pseudoruegeria sp. SHC-113]
MTNETQSPKPGPDAGGPEKPGLPRRVKLLLGLSLSLNALVVALALGAVLSPDGPRKGPPRVKDIGANAMVRALPEARQKALREALGNRIGKDGKDARVDLRAISRALQEALRAEPFDVARVDAILQETESRRDAQLAIGREVFLMQLNEMSPEERLAFADRLQEQSRRGPGKPPRD